MSRPNASTLTAPGRKILRDHKLNGIHRLLRKDPAFKELSWFQRGPLAELRLIRGELMADIRSRGVVLPDGSINPSVEAHRKNIHEQLYSLNVYAGVNSAQASKPVDIFTLMNQEADRVETVEPTAVEKPNASSESAT